MTTFLNVSSILVQIDMNTSVILAYNQFHLHAIIDEISQEVLPVPFHLALFYFLEILPAYALASTPGMNLCFE